MISTLKPVGVLLVKVLGDINSVGKLKAKPKKEI